ncbi:asparagine synthase (glutamine-hydrolyzing) [Phenylobacterium sp.]|jgi:asparagine synthase (glutamine-hydrolysing)|uniref:asparagine synthase (glutamine-hydrolyzing) n=1 Tax=Phenylobacterium sp. TaxID=1871053 RepID=UPI002E321012|nr:asparagine synthase (glutamine-hydrolyzing) [Phenylobacterium sp.]HEX3366889.1 asparagine synthase (glutamine-hydrolyzing) [Phenylobacterium sp.]
MCGIAGQVGGADARAAEMIAALTHRGPDGIRIEAMAGVAVAHARLSIIDLEGGWQPLHAAGSTVIGNGEIYNYVELTRDHQLTDVLTTGSDFEPLLHLYAREGEAAFQRLRGMYALCFIGGDGRTWLARDPFGIKPLYIMEHDGGLAFASEPRAFLKAGLMQTVLDPEPARELLSFNYTLGARTLFQGLRRLAPGEVVEVRDGRIVSNWRQPWLPKTPLIPAEAGTQAESRDEARIEPTRQRPMGPRLRGDERGLLEELDRVLEDSVRVHQRSDVPYGLFLSSGIDSAAIATLMARLNERPVTAFTCGFDAPGAADERAQAEKVARALNLDWRETTFGEADFWRIAPEVVWALDDPTADYATLPTYKLAEAAKGTLTVVLTGEGGDELFGGYGRYRRALRPAWLGGRPAEPRGADPAALARWRAEAKAPPGLTRLQQAQWADIATWLPNDLLLKLDRCLMAHGLEGRTPFLDREVAAFAFPLADNFKVRGRYGKWLLRKWLERTCPAAEPWARKQGFTVPVEAWIAPRAADIAQRIGKIDAVCQVQPDVAEAFKAGGDGVRWPLLFFALWSRIHLEGASPAEALVSVVGAI